MFILIFIKEIYLVNINAHINVHINLHINAHINDHINVYFNVYTNVHMVKSHEDAYWPDNLSLLLSTVSLTKSPKNKMMGKSGLYGLYPCWGSPIKLFFVLGKLQKTPIFEAP